MQYILTSCFCGKLFFKYVTIDENDFNTLTFKVAKRNLRLFSSNCNYSRVLGLYFAVTDTNDNIVIKGDYDVIE